MAKNSKILLAILVVVVLVGVGVLAVNASSLQGLLKPPTTIKPPYAMYNYKGRVVSGVASPVPSVVISEVTSQNGTSNVPSVVVSAVGSPVAVSKNILSTVKISSLPTLTSSILESIAKKDFASNPKKYTLSNAQKATIINLYKKEHNMK